MKKTFLVLASLWMAWTVMAEKTPIFYESFNDCLDDGSNKFVGGNDNQWGGDGVGTSLVIYFDWKDPNNAWDYDNANGAYQCVKVGTATNGGTITTPQIAHNGDATLTFRAAPWVGTDEDSTIIVSIKGGVALDATTIELHPKKWNDISIRIADIRDNVQITFSGRKEKKNRFFLDEVKVIPADPNDAVIRTEEGKSLDLGTVGKNYSNLSAVLHVIGANLKSEGITATLSGQNPDLFLLSTNKLPAEGGELTVSFKNGQSAWDYGCYLTLSGKDKNSNAKVECVISLSCSVLEWNLQGRGTKEDPFTCADVILLAEHADYFWGGRFWVTGFMLGGAGRNQANEFTGISYTNNQAIVLADDPAETDKSKMVSVQIAYNARAALNVVDNSELIGKQIKVLGDLQNDNGNPLYLGIPGVRNVNNDDQYVRPWDDETNLDNVQRSNVPCTKVLRDGMLLIERDGKMYNVQGVRCK